MDPVVVRAKILAFIADVKLNFKKYLKRVTIGLTVLVLLVAVINWYTFANDKEFKARLADCEIMSGSHTEYDTCIVYPNRDHQTKKAAAIFFTWIAVLIPIFIYGTYFAYAFFFLRNSQEQNVQ